MPQATLRVKGLRETIRAANKAAGDSGKALKEQLGQAGEVVRVEWQRRFARIDANSASGFRTKVLVRGVRVVQSKRKKTGKRGDYGSLQMRYGLGVLTDKEREIGEATEEAFDRIGDRFATR